MTLIRVYYQAVMATNFGLHDLRTLPDLRVFKQTLKVPTVNNRIGPGEKEKVPHDDERVVRHARKFFR